METQWPTDEIRWRLHLRSAPERVFDALASESGRRSFWADEAPEMDGIIHFTFANGARLESPVLVKDPPARFALEYFGGSEVRFDLAEDGAGGTDLTLTETGIPEPNWVIHLPGWIPVLLGLKAAVDFSVDLRNKDPDRSWDQGYVDV